jgi:hypothetical protein
MIIDCLTPHTLPPALCTGTAESILWGYKYSMQSQHSSHYSLIMEIETVSEMLNKKSILPQLTSRDSAVSIATGYGLDD